METLRPFDAGDFDACEAILRSLPDFFGHEGGLNSALEALRIQHGMVALRDGRVVGFATWERRTAETAEITWMAVLNAERHRGIGTAIIERVCEQLSGEGYRMALVMTSAGAKDPAVDDTYVPTRRFWKARGFQPLIELDIWDSDIALLSARPLVH